MRNLLKVLIVVLIIAVLAFLVRFFGLQYDSSEMQEYTDLNGACVELVKSNCTLATGSVAAGSASLQGMCEKLRGIPSGDTEACKKSCGCK